MAVFKFLPCPETPPFGYLGFCIATVALGFFLNCGFNMEASGESCLSPNQIEKRGYRRRCSWQPVPQSGDQIHTLIQDGNNLGFLAFRVQIENKMMLAARGQQFREAIGEGTPHDFTISNVLKTGCQRPGVLPGLRLSPLTAGITGNLSQVGLRVRGEFIRDHV